LAGGTWMAQNKVRPGAYLNFISTPTPTITIGDRGIAIMPMPLSWGSQDDLIPVFSTDMLNGRSLPKVGFTAFDEESKLLSLLLSNCYKALIFRADKGGTKASALLGNLIATAKYTGLLGNRIQVAIIDVFEDGSTYDVKTYVNAVLKNTQRGLNIEDLVSNDFVDFSGTGPLEEIEYTETEDAILMQRAGEVLQGGTDGIFTESTMYPEFLDKASIARYQTMAIPYKNSQISALITQFVIDERDNQGRYIQAVLCDYPDADTEGIINSTMGVVMNNIEIAPSDFVAWVAGATAGAPVANSPNRSASNTGKVVLGATSIIGELQHDDIIEALNSGEFILARNQDGTIRVEQDINSFTSILPNKGYMFRKNRVVRTMDEIGTSIRQSWERSYMGKVDNNNNGRAMYKGDIIQYLNSLQNLGVIDDFAGASDVDVERGIEIDAVVAEIRPKPVDSMEKLYMTVNLQS
jgi:hypothetical protein